MLGSRELVATLGLHAVCNSSNRDVTYVFTPTVINKMQKETKVKVLFVVLCALFANMCSPRRASKIIPPNDTNARNVWSSSIVQWV